MARPTKMQAFKASAFSAMVVGLTHYIGHQLAPTIFPSNPVAFVGAVVVLSVFAMAYLGMNPK